MVPHKGRRWALRSLENFHSKELKFLWPKETGPGTSAKTARAGYHSSCVIAGRRRNQREVVSIWKDALLLRPVEKLNQ